VRRVVGCILAVATLSLLDSATTLFGIGRGIFREVNPLLRNALEVHIGWFVLLKGSLTTLWASVMIREQHRRWLLYAHIGVIALYAGIVARTGWLLWGA